MRERPVTFISLDQARAQLQLDTPDDDAELQAYVDAIEGVVEEYKHELMSQRTVTGTAYGNGRSFRLWAVPVISLTSVTSWDGTTSWDPGDMRVYESGLVKVKSGPMVLGDVDVVFEAGNAVVPDRFIRGGLVILQHVWETRRAQGTVMSGVIGQEEHYRQPGEWFTVPAKAKEWLGPPRPVIA